MKNPARLNAVRNPAPQLAGLTPYDPKYLPAQVCLSANENPFPLPENVKKDILNAVQNVSLGRYPDPLAADLRKKLADLHHVQPNQVLAGNGGDELLFNIALAWGGPERTFLTTPPTFSVYENNAQLTGTSVVSVPRNKDFTLDEEAILDELRSQRIDFSIITNPNNPTGTIASKVFLREAAQASDALFVVDEAYAEFTDNSMISQLKDMPNLIILRTLSKAYGLAGVRLGYVISSPEIIRELIKVRQPYSVDAVSQAIACAVLDNQAAYDFQVEEIKTQRSWLVDQLDKLEGVEQFPSEANYILFKVEEADKIWDSLYEQGVLVRDLSRSLFLENCLRVTVGTAAENQKFIRALRESIKRRNKQ